MIQTSQRWKDYSAEIGTFHIKAKIDNGTVMNLADSDFMEGSVSISDSVSGMGAFNVGGVITNSFKATLNNFNGKFNDYNLAGAKISVQFGIDDNSGIPADVELGRVGFINGVFYPETDQLCTGFIEVNPGETYYMQCTDSFDCVEYDESKEYVNATLWVVSDPGTATVTMGATTHYIRINFREDYGTTFKHDFFIFDSSNNRIWGNYSEYIDRGTYTIEKPTSLGSTIKIVGYDDMDKMNKYYIGKYYAGANLYNKNTVTEGYWIKRDGTIEAFYDAFYTDYIAVSNNTIYDTNFSAQAAILYDSSKNYLGYANYGDKYFTTYSPNGTVAYIRCSGLLEDKNSSYVRKRKGTVLTDIDLPLKVEPFCAILCDYCGVAYDFDAWELYENTYVYEWELNESTTCRQVLGWVTQAAGGYARISNTGYLKCKAFNLHEWTTSSSMEGGTVSPWSTVSAYDGGTISPWSAVTGYDGGDIGGADFVLSKIKSLDVYIEDITITGIRAYAYNTVDEFDYYQYGSDGYVIILQDNPQITNADMQTVATGVGSKLNGLSFRPFNATIFGDPSIEAGDVVALCDYLGNIHTSLITSLTYTLNNSERLECNAKSVEEMQAELANAKTTTVKDSVEATKNDMSSNGINLNNDSVINPDGTAVFTGSVTASSFVNSSKEELKKDIKKAESTLSKVVAADIMSFKYKGSDDRKRLGLVIGEGYNTPSEIVADGGIDLYGMISMLWKALQEQQELIEQLQKEKK